VIRINQSICKEILIYVTHFLCVFLLDEQLSAIFLNQHVIFQTSTHNEALTKLKMKKNMISAIFSNQWTNEALSKMLLNNMNVYLVYIFIETECTLTFSASVPLPFFIFFIHYRVWYFPLLRFSSSVTSVHKNIIFKP